MEEMLLKMREREGNRDSKFLNETQESDLDDLIEDLLQMDEDRALRLVN